MATDRSQKTKARSDAAKNFVTLAHVYNPKKHSDVKGWLLSEKLDGVRARFHNGKLYSRSQKEFPAPKWYLQYLTDWVGDLELDGELICGDFQNTVSTVRNGKEVKLNPDAWMNLTYFVFDVVSEEHYQKRMQKLHDIVEKAREKSNVFHIPMLWAIHPSLVVESEDQIDNNLQLVLSRKGEGVMLRNPDVGYEFGRSHNLLKVKPTDSCEVTIIDSYEGDGRNAGKVGGFICETEDGKIVRVGSGLTDEVRSSPPPNGSIITINYIGLTNDGIPRHPIYVGVRDYE